MDNSAGGCLVAANDNYMPLLEEGAERSRAFSMLYADGDAELLKDPYVSPTFATKDIMQNQPRTLIINAQNCPFCESNESYGKRLIEAGTQVTMKRFLNSRHGFTIRLADEWREAQNMIIDEILDASHGTT